ncbi:MAG: ATP-binding protein [Candidatus Pseudobacter hemicellulosilyticus]|uniref:histidine kinase n=1 Tax=Candidatus Pseudobacter hemicellulosilyticus TaxID=3121375 RepID=A0AAJ5WQV6_9BACT|nr:MAG: ATP-binding protein [Pseudobacter sp.]
MRLQTKLTLGISFLFLIIVVFGVLGIVSLTRLQRDAERILQNNYETLVYNNRMLKALDQLPADSTAWQLFDESLRQQETNVTEPGEKEATQSLRRYFGQLQTYPADSLALSGIRQQIRLVNDLNQAAILRKHQQTKDTAENAVTWMSIIFTALALIAFTLVINFPSVISGPIRSLAEGIGAIAGKDYSKRIHLSRKDEFGELANAFNSMAARLDEYEHSNLAKLTFEKTRIETIINQMRDAIIGFDEQRRLLFMNTVAENLTGLREKDVAGQYGPDLALRNDLLRTLLQRDSPAELKIFADSRESYFTREYIEVKNEETIIGEVIVLRNITPFHELDEAKTNFIATVSHELKTPISGIKMSAKLLEDTRVGSLNKEQQELLQGIRDDADRLLRITSELLSLSQVETGNIQLKLQPAQPAAIVHQAVGAVQFMAQQQQLTIRTSLAPNLPAVLADPEKTSWVLINFLTNALRYSPEKGVVDLAVMMKDQRVQFTVQDQGRGIDGQYLPRIFDRYYKVPGSYEQSGTGLGLAISKEFIEAQGGAIWAESHIGEGSRFGFSLAVSPAVTE